MKSSMIGGCLLVVLAAFATQAGCDDGSTTTTATPDGGGTFDVDGGQNPVDPPVTSECTAPTKGPTTHGGGSTSDPDEVWTADASPHILPYDTTIYKTVTLEPCAEVLIGAGKTVGVRGKLIAQGTATKRVHIGAKDAGKPFASIRLNGSEIRLSYTTIDGGGDRLNTLAYLAGMLDLQGDLQLPTQESLFVDHVTLDGSKSNGLVLRDNAGFAAGSNALVIKGSSEHPLSIFARSVGGIPVGSYTGNAKDQILLPTTSNNDSIDETTTLHERGVPYLVGHAGSGGSLRVDTQAQPAKPSPVLTIEPGVTMRFKKGGALHAVFSTGDDPARGAIVAVGTADKPIVFTSDEASPAAGDWLGLRFGQVPNATNRLENVRIEYAGGTSSGGSDSCQDNSELMNDAAVRIYGLPPSQFITNTHIVKSLTNGIDRGYRSLVDVDFLATNTFTDVALCNQTLNKDQNGACPTLVPCPK